MNSLWNKILAKFTGKPKDSDCTRDLEITPGQHAVDQGTTPAYVSGAAFDPETRTIHLVKGEANFAGVVGSSALLWLRMDFDHPIRGSILRKYYGDIWDNPETSHIFQTHYLAWMKNRELQDRGKAGQSELLKSLAGVADSLAEIGVELENLPAPEVGKIFDNWLGLNE